MEMKKIPIIAQYKLYILAALSCSLHFINIIPLHAGEIKLRNLETVYDGKPKWPQATTSPERLDYTFYYRDRSLPQVPPVSETVYLNRPEALALSYFSVPLGNEKILQVGNVLHPGGEGRELETCETTLVTWARAKDYPALAAVNPFGYSHPVTMALYRVTQAGKIVPLVSQTVSVMVPWRPETLPNGDPYPYNGCAFRVNFLFPPGTLLPERLLYAVGFSTSRAGSPKMAKAGPWDSLNVAMYNPKPSIGEDEDAVYSYILYESGWTSVSWPTLSAPMLKITARDPQGETETPPVNAGTYDVRAVITSPDEVAQVKGVFVVRKAQADIDLSTPGGAGTGVSWQTYTGGQRSNLEVAVTWNGSSETPDKPGLYNVNATIADPNYEGSATTVVRIGDKFASWITRAAATSALAEEALSSSADPDQDGRPNLLEYAFASDPAQSDAGAADPGIQLTRSENGDLILTWRENPNATDLTYLVERTTTPSEAGSWAGIGSSASPEVLSETETLRVMKLTLPAPAGGEPARFFRVRVSQ